MVQVLLDEHSECYTYVTAVGRVWDQQHQHNFSDWGASSIALPNTTREFVHYTCWTGQSLLLR